MEYNTTFSRQISNISFLISPLPPHSPSSERAGNSNEDTCLRKVKRKLCKNRSRTSSDSEIRVTRNYDNYYRREFNRVSITSQNLESNNENNRNPKNTFIESLNVAKLQKDLTDKKSTKKNSHAHEVLAKWM